MKRAGERRTATVARPKKAETTFTPKMRESAEILAAAGMTDENIARALGVTPEQLRQHNELVVGAARRAGKMILALYRAGIQGNVTAQRAFLARADVAAPREAPKERKVRERPMGKKEVQEIEAHEIPHDKDWATLLN